MWAERNISDHGCSLIKIDNPRLFASLKMTSCRSQRSVCAGNERGSVLALFGFASREEPMPKASNCRLFPVCPGKVAILTVKFFRNNFQRTKHADECGRQKFPRHLGVLDV